MLRHNTLHTSIFSSGSRCLSLFLSIHHNCKYHMKNLLLSAFFVLAISGTAFAQCQPGGNGNGWGNGNGNNGNPPGGGQAAQAQAQPVITIPAWLALRICQAAQPATSMTTFQLFNAYRAGTTTITYMGVDPADPNRTYYRVVVGGIGIDVIIDNI
jgi:hypothetical protein